MWFKRRRSVSLLAPVPGQQLTSSDPLTLLAVHPREQAIYAPLDGEVVGLTRTWIELRALNGCHYQLRLTPGPVTFDWQVRVGDTVSPICLLGTLSEESVNQIILIRSATTNLQIEPQLA